MFRVSLAYILIVCFFSQFLIGFFPSVYAIDPDGTATLELSLVSEIPDETIVGREFSLNLRLSNDLSSEDDAYNPGFILRIPTLMNYISSNGIGNPNRSLDLGDGTQLLFFRDSDLIPRGAYKEYVINLESDIEIDIFTPSGIEILSYAEDNIYGVGAVPSGAPSGTLPGGIDFADSPFVSGIPNNFPNNIQELGDISGLPFQSLETTVVPFGIEKIAAGSSLIGNEEEVVLRVIGNDLGPLTNFSLEDIIPNSQKFVEITDAGGATIDIQYNQPLDGQVTLNITDINVPISGELEIRYTVLIPSHEIDTYQGTDIILNTTEPPFSDGTISNNTLTMLESGSWNDGTSNIAIDSSSILSPRIAETEIVYSSLSKSVNNSTPTRGDTLTYTISLELAENVSFDTSGGGTYIEDTLPDGISFVGPGISNNNGNGEALVFSGATIDPVDGTSSVIWNLEGGTLEAGDTLTITYQAVLDGDFTDGSTLINGRSLINTARFSGNIIDSGNNEEWGFTDPSLTGNTHTKSDTSTITVPHPVQRKFLVSITAPDGTVYDNSNPLPSDFWIPVDSRLDFVISMDFPDVDFSQVIMKDALPLTVGPNDAAYNIMFQDDTSLLDIQGNPVPINDDSGDGTFDNTFNGLALGGSSPSDSTWIDTEAPNNLIFDLGSGPGDKTFAVRFSVDVLTVAPRSTGDGNISTRNILVSQNQNSQGNTNSLGIVNIPLELGFPNIEARKETIPTSLSDVAAGDEIVYQIILENTGQSTAYLEDIIDTLPDNLDLISSNISFSGAITPISGSSVTQSGSELNISFDTSGPFARSQIGLNDPGTPDIDESVIIIEYTLLATQDFLINPNIERENIIRLDYYAADDVVSNDINRINTVEAEALFTSAGPSISRSIISTSETGSSGNNLLAGEEVTFRTTLTLPPGTYQNASFDEVLRSPQLTFLSGAIVSQGADISYTGAGEFSGNSLDFGTLINTGTSSQVIVIETEARTSNTAPRRNSNEARGRFLYNNEQINLNTPVNLIIPSLNFTKSVSPGSGDISDTLVFTFDISHSSSSNAPAYDINIIDTLPSGLHYVTGSLVGVTTFSGDETSFFSGTGITLPELPLGDTLSFSFEATLDENTRAGSNLTNIGDISYTSLPGVNPFQAIYEDSTDVGFQVTDLSVNQEVSGTSNPDTGTSFFNSSDFDVTIGEEVDYTIYIDIPNVNVDGLSLRQVLPTGVEFLTGSIVSSNVISHSLSNIDISGGNEILINLGDIENVGAGSGTGFVIQTRLRLIDDTLNTAGRSVPSQVDISYDTANTKNSNEVRFDVVEPNLVVIKSFASPTGLAGDSITTTITLTNNGSAPIYDITWQDILPPDTTASGSFTSSGFLTQLLPGESHTYDYQTIISNTVEYGEILSGPLTSSGTSLPSGSPEVRVFSGVDNASLQVLGVTGLQKILSGDDEAAIGDMSSYTLRIPIPKGETSDINITDLIPAGLEIIPGSINFTASGSVSYSGSLTPSTSSVSLGDEQVVTYSITDIINTSTNFSDTEYITINYDVVALNTSDNIAGSIKTSEVTVSYSSGETILIADPLPITIIEPNITIGSSIVYNQGGTGSIVYTLTNNGTASAYDGQFDLTLPSGVSLSSGPIITQSGSVVGFDSTNPLEVNFGELPVNTGNPLQFVYEFDISDGVPSLTNLDFNSQVTYTSQDGIYTPFVGTSSNAQRDGSGGVNNYSISDTESFQVRIPRLQTSLSVTDINGGQVIPGDVFEFTLTLTNDGDVDLSGITLNHELDSSLGDLTFISTLAGTNTSSTSSGIINISDIIIPQGEARTLVYRVDSDVSITTQTLIDSVFDVSSSSQGTTAQNPNAELLFLSGGISLVKNTVDGINRLRFREGDEIEYIFTITNSGDVPLFDIVLDDVLLGGDITASCSFSGGINQLGLGESVTCLPSNYTVSQQDVTSRNIINEAAVSADDASNNSIASDTTHTITFRSSSGGGGGGGGGFPIIIDECLNGEIINGICTEDTDEPEVKEEDTVIIDNEIEVSVDDTRLSETEIIDDAGIRVAPNGQSYTLQNDFSSCPIIDYINDDEYLFPQSGVFVDEDSSLHKDLILKFAEIGILDGYYDGTVRPSRSMTRAEFLKVALISHCYVYRHLDGTAKYTDLEVGTWQARVVEKAEELGMIHGYKDGTFQPNREISKAEAVKILMRISFIQAEQPLPMSYMDITTDWYEFYVEHGETIGLFFPSIDDYLFQPDESVERQDMVDLINRLVRFYR